MKLTEKYNQSLEKNLEDIRFFLHHIQGRVAEGAHSVICSITDEAIQQNNELHNILKSDSVYKILRYGDKHPSGTGLDECGDDNHADLYNYVRELRQTKAMKEHSEPSKEETKTDNELIAEFMGEEISSVSANYGETIRVFVLPRKPISERKTGRPIEAKYDTSWDWLMPVVKKCRQTVKGPWNDMSRLMFNPVYHALDEVDISKVHKATVEYIEFYNSQQHERK